MIVPEMNKTDSNAESISQPQAGVAINNIEPQQPLSATQQQTADRVEGQLDYGMGTRFTFNSEKPIPVVSAQKGLQLGRQVVAGAEESRRSDWVAKEIELANQENWITGKNIEGELGEALRTSYILSGGVKPDQAAKLDQASRHTGLPVETLQQAPLFQGFADKPPDYFSTFSQRNPFTTRFLEASPIRMAVANEHMEALATVEGIYNQYLVSVGGTAPGILDEAGVRLNVGTKQVVGSIFQTGVSLVEQGPLTGWGVQDYYQAGGDYDTPLLTREAAANLAFGPMMDNGQRDLQAGFLNVFRPTEQQTAIMRGSEKTMRGYWLDVVQVAPQLVAQVGAQLFGGPLASGSLIFTQIYGNSYDAYRTQGMSADASAMGALVSAALQGGLEYVGVGRLARVMRPGSPAGQKIWTPSELRGVSRLREGATAVASEGWTETIQALPEELGRVIAGNYDAGLMDGRFLDEFVDNVFSLDFALDALYQGTVGLGAGGAMVTPRLLLDRSSDIKQSVPINMIERIGVVNQEIVAKDAGLVSDYITQLAEERGVGTTGYVPASTVEMLMESSAPEAQEAILNGLGITRARYEVARAEGQTMAVDLSKAVSLVNTNAWQVLKQGGLSTTPDGAANNELNKVDEQFRQYEQEQKEAAGNVDDGVTEQSDDSQQVSAQELEQAAAMVAENAAALSEQIQQKYIAPVQGMEWLKNSLMANGANPLQARSGAILAGRMAYTMYKIGFIKNPNDYFKRFYGYEPGAEPLTSANNTGGQQNTTRVYTEAGEPVQVVYEVYDAADLITSHDDNFKPNSDFPQQLQPRERDRAAAQMQVNNIASNLIPERLGADVSISSGAPIIGPDMVVESGNGRTMAIRQAYNNGQGDGYKTWLGANAQQFGLDTEQVANMERPVLVRRRTSEVDRLAFVRAANESAVSAMTATEQARNDASMLLGTDILSLYVVDGNGQIDTAANGNFIRSFVGMVSPADRGNMLNKEGRLSAYGLSRIRNALFAAAYGDSLALEKMAEMVDDRSKNITTALVAAAPRMARLRQDIAAGKVYDLNIAAEVVAAAAKLDDLRRRGLSVHDYLNQADMFKEESPLEAAFLNAYQELGKGNAWKKLAATLNNYANMVNGLGHPGQGRMFNMTLPGKLEIFERAKAMATDDTAQTLFQGSELVVGVITPGMASALPLNKAGNIFIEPKSLDHIERGHGLQIRTLGFSNAMDFINYVLGHIDAIYAGNNKQSYALVTKQISPNGMVVARLTFRQEGDGYKIITAYPVRKDAFKNKTPLWERAQSNHSPEGAPGAVSGQSEVTLNLAPRDDGSNTLEQKEQTPNSPRGSVSFESSAVNAKATINLFSNSDASTVMHEMWHVFRRDMETLYNWDGATEQIKQDWATACAFVGAEVGEQWTIGQEEQWARAGEAYIMEGVAPSVELRGVFQRFRQWLMDVYKTVKNLDVELNDDVRAVFDRMLATEEEIAMAKSQVVQPLLTPQQWQASGLDEKQKTQLASRMDSLLEATTASFDKRKRAEWHKERRLWLRQANEDANNNFGQLRFKRIVAAGGLNDGDLSAYVDGDTMAKIAGKAKDLVRTDGGGRTLEDVAAEFNLSADELVNEILATPSRKEFIQERVEEMEAAWDNDITPLDLALTDDFLGHLEKEVMALSGGREITNAAFREALLRSASQRAIASLLAIDQSDRAVMASTFLKAQKLASKYAAKMVAEQDASNQQQLRAQALQAKEQARVAALRIRQRAELRDEVNKALRYFKRVQKSKTIQWEYLQQIRQLLEQYAVGGQPLVGKRTMPAAGTPSLLSFVAEQSQAGEQLDIPMSVLEGSLPPRLFAMNIQQLRDLRNAVKILETLGRNQTKLLASERAQSIAEAVDDIVMESTNGQGFTDEVKVPQPAHSLPWQTKFLNKVKDYVNYATPVLRLSRLMGDKFYNLIYTPINDAVNKEAMRWESISPRLLAAFNQVPNELRKSWHKVRVKVGDVAFTGEMAMLMALNWGNSGNRNAVLAGYGLTEAQALEVLDSLSEAEWQAVQDVAAVIESQWPDINATHMTLNGVPMQKVKPEPFMTKYGEMSGWYFPLVWDPSVSPEVYQYVEAEASKFMIVSPMRKAELANGFVKERTGGKHAPLLSFKVIYDHLQDTNRYITHAAAVRDVGKLLRSPAVRRAMVGRMGQSAQEQFLPWLQHAAAPDSTTMGMGKADKVVMRVLANSAKAALGFSVQVAMLQPLALFNAIPEVGLIKLAKSVGRVFGGYSKTSMRGIMRASETLGSNYYATHKFIEEQSVYMRGRRKTRDRDIRAATMENAPHKRLLEKITSDWAFALTGFMDNFIAKSVWLAAYDQAVAMGLNAKQCVDHADGVVVGTQGSGRAMDMTAWQRGGTAAKLFTMFMTPFVASGGQLREGIQRVAMNPKSPKDWNRLGKILFWTFIISSAVESLIREREDWEPEDLAVGFLDYTLTHFPFFREFKPMFVTLLNASLDTNKYAGNYRAIGISDVLDSTTKAARAMTKGEWGKTMTNFIKVIGPMTGLPSNQLNTALDGLSKLYKTGNPTDSVYLLLRDRK